MSILSRLGIGARLAAVDTMDRSGLARAPGMIQRRPEQARAIFYARKIGWVRRSFAFQAYQGARCPRRPERTENGYDWIPVEEADDPIAWAALQVIRNRRRSLRDLVYQQSFLGGTAGEYYVVLDSVGDGIPTYSIRSISAVSALADPVTRAPGYVVKDVPAGTPQRGTAQWVPADRVFRHWTPDEEYENVAWSDLMGLVDDLDTYWGLIRHVRRRTRSRLAMDGVFWTPSEAHTVKHEIDGKATKVSKLEHDFALASAAALNDADDAEVASIAPFLMHTPQGPEGRIGKPEFLPFPSLSSELLEYVKDQRAIIAAALPLSAQQALDGPESSKNHWGDWKADEEDAELIGYQNQIGDDTLTACAYRPILTRLAEAGIWKGDPGAWRIGSDLDPIRGRPDLSELALAVYEVDGIGLRALREHTHFSEDDAPSELELAQKMERQKAKAPPAPIALPAQRAIGPPPPDGDHAPPENPVPNNGQVPGVRAAAVHEGPLPVFDDRWLLDA